MPAAYSTSRPFESSSAAVALRFPSAAFLHTTLPRPLVRPGNSLPLSRHALLQGQYPWRGWMTVLAVGRRPERARARASA